MRKLICITVLSLALCLPWLPGVVAEVSAYDLLIFPQQFDEEIYPGEIWDCTVMVYNPC